MLIKELKFINDTKISSEFKARITNVFNKFLGKEWTDKFVFISYKHGEEDNVHRLIELLTRYGFDGYVDYEDDSLPKETSGETAEKLKDKIKKSKKFILIATPLAIDSKWCNWELGYADTHKYIDHLVLLPIEKENEEFIGKEYLQIYPSIQIKSNLIDIASEYYVKYPNGSEMSLSNWLKL